MASSKAKKKTYHHGDLRRALLDAAWSVLARDGLRALTLREVARCVGVTHAAPYHHFEDREALLDALTDEAFRELEAAMYAAEAGQTDPARRLEVLGRAYIDFARAHPERMEVMFRRKGLKPEVPGEVPPSFRCLVNALEACQAAGVAPSGDPMELALVSWSVVHGFATLWVEGPLAAMPRWEGRFEDARDGLLQRLVESLRREAEARPTPR